MKSNRTAKIPTGVSVIIGFGDEDLSGLEWNIGEWSEGVMYIYLSDKGSKDFIKRLVEQKNFFLFTRISYWGDDIKDKNNEYIEEEGHRGKYPTTSKEWKIRKDKSGITRTDDQIDYFIKTYSNENDTILDMTCHNNFVGDRCNLLNRNYIGVDLNIVQI